MSLDRPRRTKTGLDRVELFRKKAEEFLHSHPDIASASEAAVDSDTGPRTRIFGLIAAGIHAFGAGKYVSGTLERNYDFSRIPVNPERYDFVEQHFASGYWSEVYRLEPKEAGDPKLVLKIEFPLKHHPVSDLLAIVKGYQADYQALRKAYSHIEGIIPESSYFITRSPRTKQPAIAVLQTFIGNGAFDVLSAKNSPRVRSLIESDSVFRAEFEAFRARTLELSDLGTAPDLAGADNVLVVEIDGVHHLRIVDHHRFDDDNTVAQNSQQRALARLRAL